MFSSVLFRLFIFTFISLNNASFQNSDETITVLLDADRLKKNFIKVLRSPEMLTAETWIEVEYRCSGESLVGVEVTATSDYQTNSRIYHKYFPCSHSFDKPKRKLIKLSLSDYILFRRDYLLKHSKNIYNVQLRGWLLSKNELTDFVKRRYYDYSRFRVSYPVKILPPYSRPRRNLYQIKSVCLPWLSRMLVLHLKDKHLLEQCKVEPEIVDLVSFPVALTGSLAGVSKDLPTFTEPGIRHQVKLARGTPRFTFVVYIYILEPCEQNLCSIIQRKTHYTNMYTTPLIFVNREGKVHIQAVMEGGKPHSMLTMSKIPIGQWVRIVFAQNNRKWTLTFNYGDNFEKVSSTSAIFPRKLIFDDQEAMTHIGGSKTCESFKGYAAHAKLWRLKALDADKIKFVDDVELMRGIQSHTEKCQRFKKKMNVVIGYYQEMMQYFINQRSTIRFTYNAGSFKKMEPVKSYCNIWTYKPSRKYKIISSILKRFVMDKPCDLGDKRHCDYNAMYDGNEIGRILFEKAAEVLKTHLRDISGMVIPLQQASCYGNHRATHMVAIMFSEGIGARVDITKSLTLELIGAQDKGRLSAMALGSQHALGQHGLPLDFDYAFYYYSLVAAETSSDREKHDPGSIYTEHIRLTDTAALKTQSGEKGDYFLWLKYQAKHGMADAQSNVARMLFWGAQGVPRNMEAAVRYYEMGVEEHPNNPIALYDYGIILLRGQGVEKNHTKAVEQLSKSADLGHSPAMTALGWYYLNIKRDIATSIEFFEKAYALNDRDAAYNLGFLYQHGKYPDHPVDRAKAFTLHMKAAIGGHIDSSIILAHMYNEGHESMPRNNNYAMLWARYIAFLNPELGIILRKGLDGYFEGDWSAAFVYYIMAAETGLEVAQFNMAYLCEENFDGLASSFIKNDCKWKYYNLSSIAEQPYPESQIKMGDFHYYGCLGKQDIPAAVDMYSRAAVVNEPQALFNLAFLVEEGIKLNQTILKQLKIDIPSSNQTGILMKLYERCRDSGRDESYLPCGLALLRVQLIDIYNRYNAIMKLSSAVGLASVSVVTLLSLVQHFKNREQIVESV